jgi:hypothetical protein
MPSRSQVFSSGSSCTPWLNDHLTSWTSCLVRLRMWSWMVWGWHINNLYLTRSAGSCLGCRFSDMSLSWSDPSTCSRSTGLRCLVTGGVDLWDRDEQRRSYRSEQHPRQLWMRQHDGTRYLLLQRVHFRHWFRWFQCRWGLRARARACLSSQVHTRRWG